MQEKRIGINTLFLIPGKVGGTEIFLRNLVEELGKLDTRESYYIFTNKENDNLFDQLPRNFVKILCPVSASNKPARILWEQLILPIQCLFLRIDLLHSPGYIAPIITHCLKITTVFDLNYHFHPEDINRFQLVIYKILIPLVVRTSDGIIVHSKKSKNDMVNVLKTKRSKIFVVYPGIKDIFRKKFTKREIDNVITKHRAIKPYILSNAVSHPHKNLPSLILAYSRLINDGAISHNLVLLGFAGKDQSRLEDIVKEHGLQKKVIFTGWVDPDKVPYFYQGADLFVFPSLYEGFGLPSIEAMASKVPLVASNCSCIPEVVGNGGVLVNTKDISELAKAMRSVLKNQKLKDKIVTEGTKRAEDFKWFKMAEETRILYLRLLNIKDEKVK